MSLLMDALKKAEEEKKKAAKRLEQLETDARADDMEDGDQDNPFDDVVGSDKAGRFTETMRLSLEPIDAQNNEEDISQLEIATVKAFEPEIEKEVEQEAKEITDELSIEDINISEDLTMENTISSSAASQESFEQTQEAIDLNDTTIIEGLSTENVSAPFDDTFHGVLFENDEENVDIYEETLPGVPADQLIKDIGGGEYQPTPVAAQTVFSAGRSKTNNRTSWGIFFVLAILAFGSFGVFYYFTITPVVRKLPSPIVARGIESLTVPGAALSQFEQANAVSNVSISEKIEEPVGADSGGTAVSQEEPPIEQEQETVTTVQEANQLSDVVVDNAQIDPDITNEVSSVNEPIVETAAPIESPVEVIEEETEAIVSEREAVVAKPDEVAEPPGSEMLKISKNTAPLKQNVMISEAFKAYQAGQLDSAENLYRNALQDAPGNRDIHLGLAAIAINKGDRESAYSHYIKLLDLNPDDAFALSSLITLSRNSDPIKDESMIKNLIHKEGKVPYLYFALGNIYAKQERWAEAQQAFFDAYSMDSTNPDYVLNLAISLDKMGQYAAALDFYNVAVELAQRVAAKFNLASVNDRIRVLNQVVAKAL